MTDSMYLPVDDITGTSKNFDLAADFLELAAFFAGDSTALASDLANQAGIGAEDEHADLDEEMQSEEEDLVSSTVTRIEERQRALGPAAYPFELDNDGDLLTCNLDRDSFGHAAYISSLVLSNLGSVTPVLDGSHLHPDEDEVRGLREFFQYFATAALASELQGSAWSFGSPRPDGSGFLELRGCDRLCNRIHSVNSSI